MSSPQTLEDSTFPECSKLLILPFLHHTADVGCSRYQTIADPQSEALSRRPALSMREGRKAGERGKRALAAEDSKMKLEGRTVVQRWKGRQDCSKLRTCKGNRCQLYTNWGRVQNSWMQVESNIQFQPVSSYMKVQHIRDSHTF